MKPITLATGVLLVATAANGHDRPGRSTNIRRPATATVDEGEMPYLASDKLFLWRIHWINHMEIQSGDLAKTHGEAASPPSERGSPRIIASSRTGS